jgi:hypothetical protein
MSASQWWCVLAVLLVVGSVQAEQALSDTPAADPFFGQILVVDKHNLLDYDLASGIFRDAEEHAHDHDSLDHWHVLASPSTFSHWLNVSSNQNPTGHLRNFQWHADHALFELSPLSTASHFHWRLTDDPTSRMSGPLMLKAFSTAPRSRHFAHAFGPEFNLHLLPEWAFFLLQLADNAVVDQAYRRALRLRETQHSTPAIAAVVDSLWDSHGVWIGHDPTAPEVYPLQPHLRAAELDFATLSDAEVAQLLFSVRINENLANNRQLADPADLIPYLTRFPNLQDVAAWRAASAAGKFALIKQLVESIASRPPPRFRHTAGICWMNPTLDGELEIFEPHFSSFSIRVLCWLLSTASSGLPTYLRDWMIAQNPAELIAHL